MDVLPERLSQGVVFDRLTALFGLAPRRVAPGAGRSLINLAWRPLWILAGSIAWIRDGTVARVRITDSRRVLGVVLMGMALRYP